MKKAFPLSSLFVSLALALPSMAAQADAPSCASLQQMLAGGSSAEAVIAAVAATGVNRADATVYAMDCAGDGSREALVAAGVAGADNLAQAQSVTDAVLAVAGENAAVINAANFALRDYIRQMPQPDVYEDQYTPTGGGFGTLDRDVSRAPVQPPVGGGPTPPSGGPTPPSGGPTPPSGGPTPPVSPAQ